MLINVRKIQQTIHEDQRQDTCDIVELHYLTCQQILKNDLHVTHCSQVCAKTPVWSPEAEITLCLSELKDLTTDPNLLSNIIMSDEILSFMDVAQKQSSQWKSSASPRPKKTRQVNSNMMLTYFFDQEEIVHKMFVPAGEAVNANFYQEVFVWGCEEEAANKVAQQQLAAATQHPHLPETSESGINQNGHRLTPLYLAPRDFFLFPKIKFWLKGRRFDTTEEMQDESLAVLDSQMKKDYQECSEVCQQC